MEEVEQAILDAWAAVGPRLFADSRERRRRLARRGGATLIHPPRAACLALRAADTRLPPRARNVSEWGVSACGSRARTRSSSPRHPHTPHPDTLHTLTLRDLQRLCLPVTLECPNLSLAEVAQRLGVTKGGLLRARAGGTFRHHYVEGLGGHWGKPTPLLTADGPLDPAAGGFAVADRAWRPITRAIVDRLPGDFPPQTLYRVPIYGPRGPDHSRDPATLHPEHPLRDPGPSPIRRRKSLALPKPPPDLVCWYKWKGDEYIGYDWRNPRIALAHLKREIAKAKSRLARKQRRREKAVTLRVPVGSLEFRGHAWLCPRCARPARLLFLPVAGVWPDEPFERELARLKLPSMREMLASVGRESQVVGRQGREQAGLADSNHPQPPTPDPLPTTPDFPTFACAACLRLRRFSRCDRNAWNEVVTYLSGGLLFGREVRRPGWFTPDRKLAHAPRPTRAPSIRRPQIERLLLAGRTFRQIAAELGLAYGTVLWTAQQVYKQHGVRTLPDLLRKHGHAIGPPLTKEVRRRLLAGQPIAQIAAETGCGKTLIYNQRQAIRKAGVKLSDGRKHNGGNLSGKLRAW